MEVAIYVVSDSKQNEASSYFNGFVVLTSRSGAYRSRDLVFFMLTMANNRQTDYLVTLPLQVAACARGVTTVRTVNYDALSLQWIPIWDVVVTA
jgi:hypothetical protein